MILAAPAREAAQGDSRGTLVPALPRPARHHRDAARLPHSHRVLTTAALVAWLAPLIPGIARSSLGVPPELPYWVPDMTLTVGEAHRLGIRSEDDLFGGVVPAPVVAGKAITHPLTGAHCAHPAEWSPAFVEAVRGHTLAGYSAFSPEDSVAAGQRVLARGAARLKPAWADGGFGQVVVRSPAELAAALEKLDVAELAVHGLVVEQNLADAQTFSVGRVKVGRHEIAYVGTQTTTVDNEGGQAYGGSRLHLMRGGFAELMATPMPAAFHRAAGHARAYDKAADRHYPAFFASRRNYDVVVGKDADGSVRAGVLEQSWRIGGASGAEIAALRAFSDDPTPRSVIASCHEVYGPAANPPQEAEIYHHADDPEVGYITKYAVIESRSHA